MFEMFRARSIERDQALDEKRIAKMMGCLSEIQNGCMDELDGLSKRMQDYKENRPGPDKNPSLYFERPQPEDSILSLTAAEKRIELLNGYINTCMKLRAQFMVDIKTNQSAVDNLMEHSNVSQSKTSLSRAKPDGTFSGEA
jgi:hypothetical protein